MPYGRKGVLMKAKKRILYIGLALWLIAFLQMIHTGLNPVSEEEAIVTAFADNDFSEYGQHHYCIR